MSKGERATITCPPDYAYGNQSVCMNKMIFEIFLNR
jgi:FKBP-type peptidyl-prolyl cis-trans isomerase